MSNFRGICYYAVFVVEMNELEVSCHPNDKNIQQTMPKTSSYSTVVMCSHSTADVPKQSMMLGVVTNEQ